MFGNDQIISRNGANVLTGPWEDGCYTLSEWVPKKVGIHYAVLYGHRTFVIPLPSTLIRHTFSMAHPDTVSLPDIDSKPSQKKPRHRHSPAQLAALNELFDQDDHPPLELRSALARRLGM